MAPIGDDIAQKILDSIQDLQSRIKKLEDGIHHKAGGSPPPAVEGVRMILMGPPGAGMWFFRLVEDHGRLIRFG
jgi:adenylate kinase